MIFDRKPTEYGQPTAIVPMPKADSPSHGLPRCAIIDVGLNIAGDLVTERDVQVDGLINGNVSCARLTIGTDGAIRGDIKAKRQGEGCHSRDARHAYGERGRCRRYLLRQDAHGRRPLPTASPPDEKIS